MNRSMAAMAAVALLAGATTAKGAGEAPALLSETGLYADLPRGEIAPHALAYSPQYPLWTDGATKRRWILFPPGAVIDASDPDRWVFPEGTKLFKEFSFGHRVETRMLERGADDQWIFATYLWRADGSDADLVGPAGLPGLDVGGGRLHDVPGRWDCLACHASRPEKVLGFGALQLSPDRDPCALHAETPPPGAVDLDTLRRRGLVTGLPENFPTPTIEASTPVERSMLGYLHANCGSCHHEEGNLSGVPLRLHRSANEGPIDPKVLDTIARGASDPTERSLVLQRIRSDSPQWRMPPLGTRQVDVEAVALIQRWLREREPSLRSR